MELISQTLSNNSQNNSQNKKSKIKHEWKEEHENILVDWADQATCYRWLHDKSHNKYSCRNAWFTIPVIIISTLTGTANFAQQHIPIIYQSFFSMSIGCFNIFAGIVTTVGQFLKISELNEAHRVSSISWDKFSRDIKVELCKSPEDRIDPELMLKKCKEEFDRLIETSPSVPKSVIVLFNYTFGERKYNLLNMLRYIVCCGKVNDELNDNNPLNFLRLINERQKLEEFSKVTKPAICDVLKSARNSQYDRSKLISSKIQNEIDKQKRKEEEFLHFKYQIEEFKKQFLQAQKREPLDDEIIEEFDDIIPSNILNSILISILENTNNEEEKQNIHLEIK